MQIFTYILIRTLYHLQEDVTLLFSIGPKITLFQLFLQSSGNHPLLGCSHKCLCVKPLMRHIKHNLKQCCRNIDSWETIAPDRMN